MQNNDHLCFQQRRFNKVYTPIREMVSKKHICIYLRCIIINELLQTSWQNYTYIPDKKIHFMGIS